MISSPKTREHEATPPKVTRVMARLLPRPLRACACLGLHTLAVGHGDCVVCGRDWTRGRKFLRFYGTRSPHRRNRPSETAVHLLLTPQVAFHRIQGYRCYYWLLAWRWHGDQRQANLRPRISFNYRNVSLDYRRERASQQSYVEDEE
jgi:hypothetical protein